MAKGSGGSGRTPIAGPSRPGGDAFGQFKRLPNTTVTYSSPEAKAHRDRLFPGISDGKLAAAVGALDGARVIISRKSDNSIDVEVKHPDINGQFRRVRRVGKGIVISNDYFRAAQSGSGIGTRSFASEVYWARQLGASRIETYAARGAGFNGYYTWARLGYDAKLGDTRRRLPPSLKSAKTVRDLFELPGGKEWWKENGGSTSMRFDLRPNSRSMKALSAYLREKQREGR